MLGAWPPLPRPPGGEKFRSGLGGAPPPEPIPTPWRSPPTVGEGPGGGRQAGRGGGAASGLAGPRGPGGRAPASRAPTSGPSGPSDRVTSRSPAARPPGALDAMKQLCLCAAASFAVGPGEGAREGAGAGPSSPPRPAPPPDRAEPRPSTRRPERAKLGGQRKEGKQRWEDGWHKWGDYFEDRWGHLEEFRGQLGGQFWMGSSRGTI